MWWLWILAGAECPPCFNCRAPEYQCVNFGECIQATGHCKCPLGYGGIDCGSLLCGSLAKPNSERQINPAKCDCDEGWIGSNCNVCRNNKVCGVLQPIATETMCFQSMLPVVRNYAECKVLNDRVDMYLSNSDARAVISCGPTSCLFDFVVYNVTSFACFFNECSSTRKYNLTQTNCNKVQCKCLPDHPLCPNGEGLSEILQTVTGPATIECKPGTKYEFDCEFREKTISETLAPLIGEQFTLGCQAGECIDSAMVPIMPESQNINFAYVGVLFIFTLLVFSIAPIMFCVRICLCAFRKRHITIIARNPVDFRRPSSTLAFKDVFYTLPGHHGILTSVHGVAPAGQLLAIMGASGSGKTSLLDILAKRSKWGTVSGQIDVNGHQLSRSHMRKITAYVYQDDLLLPTLTVQEAITYSAMLRLPSSMDKTEKYERVRETMEELGISHIADRRIGSASVRGISGGEKRRVSIACEMVTAPSILFLDEPTSGLDAYNALSVIESLSKLAKTYNITVICTIHQPRSNIYAFFDNLLLLSHGEVVYYGAASRVNDHFKSLGRHCPEGYNIADYIIDLAGSKTVQDGESSDCSTPLLTSAPLAKRYLTSTAYAEASAKLSEAMQVCESPSTHQRILLYEKLPMRLQIAVLAERTFTNVIRNPQLLLSHYIVSIVAGIFCGLVFYQVPKTAEGMQSRIGCFFFVCTLFSVSSLSLMPELAKERALFIRERANRYYSPFVYYLCKIIFDVIPICAVPPILFGLGIYPLMGLVADLMHFLKFMLVLVLLNLSASTACLCIALGIRNFSVASLVASLVVLMCMLFNNLVSNKMDLPPIFTLIKTMSFYNCALEALVANELRTLTIVLKKYGLVVVVPASGLMAWFGFDSLAYEHDVWNLASIFLVLLFMGYLLLQFVVKEKR